MTPEHLEAFFYGTAAIVADGLGHARQDDPHRFARLAKEFDEGKAVVRLMVDDLNDGKIRVTQLLIGMHGGKRRVIQIFSTLLQGPHGGATH